MILIPKQKYESLMKLTNQNRTLLKPEYQKSDSDVPSKMEVDKYHLHQSQDDPLVSECMQETQTGGKYAVKRKTSGAPPGYRKKNNQGNRDFKWITF